MRRGKILVESQIGEAPTLHFQANIKTGLSAAQVEAQRDAGNINTAVAPPTKTISAIIKENLFTYFNLVFIILAVLVMAAGSFRRNGVWMEKAPVSLKQLILCLSRVSFA